MTGNDGDTENTSEALCFALVHPTKLAWSLHKKKSEASAEMENETVKRCSRYTSEARTREFTLHAPENHAFSDSRLPPIREF